MWFKRIKITFFKENVMQALVEVTGLTKYYKNFLALDAINF